MKDLLLEFDRVSYRNNGVPVLHDIRLSLPGGCMTAILGRNGAGKSTLLGATAGLCSVRGRAVYDGSDLLSLSPTERARRLALMQQLPRAPHITVETLVAFGRKPYLSASDHASPTDTAAVEAAMADADLYPLRKKYLDEISGGELRRAYFGMALAQKTPLLLLDEATAHMDADYEAAFLSHLVGVCAKDGKTVLSVMHNLQAAVRYAKHIVVIDGGGAVFAGSATAFCESEIPARVFHVRRVMCGRECFFVPL